MNNPEILPQAIHPLENRPHALHRGFMTFLLAQFPQVLPNVETVARLAMYHDEDSAHFLALFQHHPDYAAISPERLQMPIALSDAEQLIFNELKAAYDAFQETQPKSSLNKGPTPILNGRSKTGRGKGSPHYNEHKNLRKKD